MKLSIVTVCYNDLRGLEETLASLRSQTVSNFEHWIIDGASTDGTVDLLSSVKEKWDLHWLSEKDRGTYDAMNKGIARVSGDFVWFLNSGDVCRDTKTVEDILRLIEQNPERDLIYGRSLVKTRFGLRPIGAPVTKEDFRIGMPIQHQAILYQRASLRDRAYRTDFRIISDWILTREIFEKGSSVFVDRVFTIFDSEGISSKQHWRTLKEKLRYEKDPANKARIALLSGGKYLAIWLTKKSGLYPLYKKIAHARYRNV